MRSLDDRFLSVLKDGCLSDLTAAVRSDATLCLELRGGSINVYYRGGNLMELRQSRRSAGEYRVSFDRNYFAGGEEVALPDGAIRGRAGLAGWLAAWPGLKRSIDRWLSRTRANAEKECQQLAARDNNFGTVARDTDYYVCDIEFQSAQGRFDMVAVHWPSVPAVRTKAHDRRLAFAEVKYGDSALGNLHSHIHDINDFAADARRLADFKADMVRVFNQKRELGLIDCGRKLAGFSGERPILLLMLANHDPQKSALSKLLRSLPASPHVDVRIATASFLGYGLYDQGIHSVQTALERFGDRVFATRRQGAGPLREAVPADASREARHRTQVGTEADPGFPGHRGSSRGHPRKLARPGR